MSKINQIFADTSSTMHVLIVTTGMTMSFRGDAQETINLHHRKEIKSTQNQSNQSFASWERDRENISNNLPSLPLYQIQVHYEALISSH